MSKFNLAFLRNHWAILNQFLYVSFMYKETKTYKYDVCHMAKMTSIPMYGKNPSNIFFTGTYGLISKKNFVCKIIVVQMICMFIYHFNPQFYYIKVMCKGRTLHGSVTMIGLVPGDTSIKNRLLYLIALVYIIVADRQCFNTNLPVTFDQWDLGNLYRRHLLS